MLRSDRKLRALSSKVGVMSCVLGRSGGVDAEACGDAISQCLSVGPSASNVVHGIVRACELCVETGVVRLKIQVVQGSEFLVGIPLVGDQVDEGDTSVGVGRSEGDAAFDEAATQGDILGDVVRALREENVERVRSILGARIENALAV